VVESRAHTPEDLARMELRDRCIELVLPAAASSELDWTCAVRDAGLTRTRAKNMLQGNKRRIVPVGGAALTALSALARDGWERAGTRWRCLSARVAPACAAHSLAPQTALQSAGLATPVHPHVAPFVCQSPAAVQ
jgi:hypothetical protein